MSAVAVELAVVSGFTCHDAKHSSVETKGLKRWRHVTVQTQ